MFPRLAKLILVGLLACAFSGVVQIAIAQAVLVEGIYRGGSNGIGQGCTLGAERCQVGLLLDFAKTPAGQNQVTFYRGGGTAFYEAMKDGRPYDKEDKMEVKGILPVVPAKDGTFSFSYNFDGDVYIYDQCSLPQAGVLRCYFHKRLGSSKGWLTFYKR